MKILSNIKFLWIIILILIVLNIASITAVWIEERGDEVPVLRERAMMNRRDHFLKRELNFTDEQQAQFDSFLDKHRNQLESKLEEIRTLREELMGMMRNQEFSTESENIVRQIGEKQSELELMNYQHFKDVMSICNEEQKQMFLETIKRAVGPHHGRPGFDDRNEDMRGPGRRGRR
jgi:Spy/CpxP family protein refolding chaperone